MFILPLVTSTQFAALDESKVRDDELFMHRYVFYMHVGWPVEHFVQEVDPFIHVDILARRLLERVSKRRRRGRKREILMKMWMNWSLILVRGMLLR